jgi:uncharacterized protein (DUF433 family)
MTTVLDGHITIDEQRVARVAGTRMKVIHLVMDMIANHSSPDEMEAQFPSLSLAQIHAALTYYYDHKVELDAQIEQEAKDVEVLRAHAAPQPSREELRARLSHQSQAGDARP